MAIPPCPRRRLNPISPGVFPGQPNVPVSAVLTVKAEKCTQASTAKPTQWIFNSLNSYQSYPTAKNGDTLVLRLYELS